MLAEAPAWEEVTFRDEGAAPISYTTTAGAPA